MDDKTKTEATTESNPEVSSPERRALASQVRFGADQMESTKVAIRCQIVNILGAVDVALMRLEMCQEELREYAKSLEDGEPCQFDKDFCSAHGETVDQYDMRQHVLGAGTTTTVQKVRSQEAAALIPLFSALTDLIDELCPRLGATLYGMPVDRPYKRMVPTPDVEGGKALLEAIRKIAPNSRLMDPDTGQMFDLHGRPSSPPSAPPAKPGLRSVSREIKVDD